MAEKALDIILGAKGADAAGSAIKHVGEAVHEAVKQVKDARPAAKAMGEAHAHAAHQAAELAKEVHKVARAEREAGHEAKESGESIDREIEKEVRGFQALARAIKNGVTNLNFFKEAFEAFEAGTGAGLVLFLAGQFREVFHAATETEDAVTGVRVALRVAGDTADDSADKMKDFAFQMEKLTGISHAQILEAASLGASIGHLGADSGELQQATKAAIGLSARLGVDLHTAMQLVGRAAQGNFSIFSRYGLQIDKTTTATENYNAIIRQGIQSFSQAEAKTETLGGALAKFRARVDTVYDAIGRGLGHVMPPILDAIGEGFDKLAEMAEGLGASLEPVWGDVVAFAKGAFRHLEEGVRASLDFIKQLWFDHGGELIGFLHLTWNIIGGIVEAAVDVVKDAAQAIVYALKTVITWLGNSVTPWEILKVAAIIAMSVMEYAVNNWETVLITAFAQMMYWNLRLEGQIEHVFTQVIPAWLLWFRNQWVNIFQTIIDFNRAFTENAGKNIANFVQATKDALSGKGWHFNYQSLTEGFKNSIGELPKIAARQAGPMEKVFKDLAESGRRAMSLGIANTVEKNFDDMARIEAERRAKLKDFAKETAKQTADAAADAYHKVPEAAKKALQDGKVALDLKSSLTEAHQQFTGATASINHEANTMRQQLVDEAKRGNDISAGIRANTDVMADHAREQRQAVRAEQVAPDRDTATQQMLKEMLDQWKMFKDDRDRQQQSMDQLVANTDPNAGDQVS